MAEGHAPVSLLGGMVFLLQFALFDSEWLERHPTLREIASEFVVDTAL